MVFFVLDTLKVQDGMMEMWKKRLEEKKAIPMAYQKSNGFNTEVSFPDVDAEMKFRAALIHLNIPYSESSISVVK